MKNSKKNKTIESLEFKANKGDFKSIAQLAEYYRDGLFVEKNEVYAKELLGKALDLFENKKLRVSSIKLIDFRRFKSIEVELFNEYQYKNNNNLTVIVGNNGSGKTSILDAIVKNLFLLSNRIIKKGGNAKSIELTDINNAGEVNYSSIIMNFSIFKNLVYEVEMSKTKEGVSTSRKADYTEISQLSEMYRMANTVVENYNLPIMAYYSVNRTIDIERKDIDINESEIGSNISDKFLGYHQALNGATDFKSFFKWFKTMEDNRNSDSNNDDDISKELRLLEKQAIILETASEDEQKSETFIKMRNSLTSQIESLRLNFSEKDKSIPTKSLSFVCEALYVFMPDFSNLRVGRGIHLDLLIDKHGETLSVQQLSQGEKTLIALISDIARRLVLLNPSLENPLKGDGIVLVDEIDLHLHPKWQQTILPQLAKTFPNVQFIVTTHSPQVLSTIPRECIINILERNNEKIAKKPIVQTYGVPSNDVMQTVMNVDPQPPIDELDKLNELTQLVDEGEYGSEKVKLLLTELQQKLTPQHPQMQKILRSIRRQEAFK